MNNAWLASYIEENLVKDIQASGRWTSSGDICGHWIRKLREAEKLGAHEWNNLAAIIAGMGQLLGKNYNPALLYCSSHTAGNRFG